MELLRITGFLLCINLPTLLGEYLPGRYYEGRYTYRMARLNNLYQDNLKTGEQKLYIFTLDRLDLLYPERIRFRLHVQAYGPVDTDCPLQFTLRSDQDVIVIKVPYRHSIDSPTYFNAEETLCMLNRISYIETERNVTVTVTSCNEYTIPFDISLKRFENFRLPAGEEVSFQVSPSAPQFYGFIFYDETELVKIVATSPDPYCATLSIQPLSCPVYVHEQDVRFKGLWQTMSTDAALTISKTNRYRDGFILAVVVHETDEKCEKKSSFISPFNKRSILNSNVVERKKMVSLEISNVTLTSPGILFLCLFIPVLMTVFVIVVVGQLFKNRHENLRKQAEKKFHARFSKDEEAKKKIHIQVSSPSDEIQLAEIDENALPPCREEIYASEETSINAVPLKPVEETLGGYTDNKGIYWPSRSRQSSWHLKSNLTISQFGREEESDENKKSSRRFYWMISLIAFFYIVPVYQLILHYLRVLYNTGEYDICYYNYLCANRLGILLDFNHLWSNISYILLGFSFIHLVRQRDNNLQYRKKIATSPPEEEKSFKSYCLECHLKKIYVHKNYGIPQRYGVFYALGIALTTEGFLSAGYHLCPNQSSFQFDTCFMYVMAVLLILKIYEFRHPIHLGANHTFLMLAGIVGVTVIGLIFEFQDETSKKVYRYCIIAGQYVIMTICALYNYSIGYVRDGDGQAITDWRFILHLSQLKRSKVMHGDRLILSGLTILVSTAVIIYVEVTEADFATYILYTLVANVIVCTVYYIGIMKPLHGEFKERSWVQPSIYFISAIIIGGFAMYYFTSSPTSWEKSASASRASNQECLDLWFPFHPYYDVHDVWHFLSAIALFLAFSGLLIVDDDLLLKHRSEIPVF